MRDALDLASTAVVDDDVDALTGTSHRWRRGLSFAGGLAALCSMSDYDGPPTVVRAFRLALLAQRLGTTPQRAARPGRDRGDGA